MSFNTFGKIFRFTTWGESHGPAIGCVIDGCPPNIHISEREIQKDMDRRRPGQSKFTTQRKESDKVTILSGVFQGKTTGTPISIIIYNVLGQKIRTLDKSQMNPGYHSMIWNATNDYGVQVSAGMYFYQLRTSEFVKTKKMILLK